MAELKEGLVGGAVNLYFIYKFLRILTTPWENTDAFKLGIIDKNGGILRKKRTLLKIEEKEAYTMMHRLVWKLKRLMEKIPFGKSRLASYAAALWLIKEEKSSFSTDEELQESFLSFLESNWKNDAVFLKEKYEGDMGKKTYSMLREYKAYPGKGWLDPEERPKINPKDIVWRSQVHRWDSEVRSDNTRMIVVDTGKSGKEKFQMYAVSDKSGEVLFHWGGKPTMDDVHKFREPRKWRKSTKEEVEIKEYVPIIRWRTPEQEAVYQELEKTGHILSKQPAMDDLIRDVLTKKYNDPKKIAKIINTKYKHLRIEGHNL